VQFLAEGGLPLVALTVAWIVLVFVHFVRGSGRPSVDQGFVSAGYSLAILACAAHAIVNFTYYSLPIGVLLGVASAHVASTTHWPTCEFVAGRLIGVGLAFGWVAWLYLALDVGIYGVFQGQKGVPGAAWVRQSEARALEFSRFAQALNGERGVPPLAEAMILRRRLEAEPASVYLREKAREKFGVAINVDPWNPIAYLELARLLGRFPAAGESRTREELLLTTVGLNPVFVPGIDALVSLYQQNGENPKANHLLRRVVYPWLPLLKRRSDEAPARYLALLERFARENGDPAFLAEIDDMRERLAGVGTIERDVLFF